MTCRLLYLVGSLVLGGLERQLVLLLQAMDRTRYRPAVAVWDFDGADPFVRAVRALDVPLHAVMGGFHLSGEQIEEIIPDTVRDMAAFGLKRIVPAHCTGWRAVTALVNRFGEQMIVPSAVGRQFVF